MVSRRTLLGSAAFALGLAVISSAHAAGATPFSQAAFDAAIKAGKPVLIEVSAPWCPVCKAQKPILAELTAQPKFKDLVFLEIDFDSQKDVLRTLRVQSQSTLVTFKGGKETGRSTGDTNKASIAALLDKAI